MRFMSIDSKPMRFLSCLGDLIALNLLFVITSLPIFTIGASTTALYTVLFHLDGNLHMGIFREYMEAFRSNFRKATKIWLLLLPLLAVLCLNLRLTWVQPVWGKYGCIPFGICLVLALFVAGYAFPLLSQFENTVKGTLRNAWLLSLGFFPRSLLIALLNILPFLTLYRNFVLFLYLGIFWIMFYFALSGFVNVRLFRKIFAPYMENDEQE